MLSKLNTVKQTTDLHARAPNLPVFLVATRKKCLTRPPCDKTLRSSPSPPPSSLCDQTPLLSVFPWRAAPACRSTWIWSYQLTVSHLALGSNRSPRGRKTSHHLSLWLQHPFKTCGFDLPPQKKCPSASKFETEEKQQEGAVLRRKCERIVSFHNYCVCVPNDTKCADLHNMLFSSATSRHKAELSRLDVPRSCGAKKRKHTCTTTCGRAQDPAFSMGFVKSFLWLAAELLPFYHVAYQENMEK